MISNTIAEYAHSNLDSICGGLYEYFELANGFGFNDDKFFDDVGYILMCDSPYFSKTTNDLEFILRQSLYLYSTYEYDRSQNCIKYLTDGFREYMPSCERDP